MPTYNEWNTKLLEYVLSGLPRGSRVYLSIDDEALDEIGQSFVAGPFDGSWVQDFTAAVRYKCVVDNAVALSRILPVIPRPEGNEPPRYLAFLCAMALAAHRMHYDEKGDVVGNDFFTWFNEILGLKVKGRPPSLEDGAEEILWKDWSNWLRERGYLPSAQKTGPMYITYAISQALLRESDRDSLWHHFGTHPGVYGAGLTRDDLMEDLRADARSTGTSLTKHLKQLVISEGEVGKQRYDDLALAVSEIYEEWIASGDLKESVSRTRAVSRTSLTAGLYRVEDPISRRIAYHLFPRQPRHTHLTSAHVHFEDGIEQLTEERPGWFSPLWEVTTSHLNNGAEYPLDNAGSFKKLLLPARDFWVLTPDNDDPDSGVFAAWEHHPELGVPFVLLCKVELLTQLQRLKDEGLIDWNSRRKPFDDDDSWVEIYGITVISDGWKGVHIDNKSLDQQLAPQQSIGVALRGGIRDPRSSAWLEGYGPELIVYTFEDYVQIRLVSLNGEEALLRETQVQSGESIPLQNLKSGLYRVEIHSSSNKLRTREVRIIPWDRMLPSDIPSHAGINIGQYTISGAWITPPEG